MASLTHPFVTLGLFSTTVALAIAAVSWLNRDARGAGVYSVLMSILAGWSTLYVLQLLAPSVAGKRLLLLARHAISPAIVACYWVFSVRYTDTDGRLGWRVLGPLLGLGGALFVAAMLNPRGLYLEGMTLATTAGITVADVSFGPLFWLMLGYIAVVVGGAHKLIVDMFLDSFAAHREQLIALSFAAGFEVVLLVLFLSGQVPFLPALNPWPNLQLVTYGVTFVSIPFVWSYFSADLFDMEPLARRTVLENMTDAVIVFDADDRVVNANERAADLLGAATTAALTGRSFDAVFDAVPEIRTEYADTSEAEGELTIDIDGRERHVHLTISPIESSSDEYVGRVFVGRDITEQKRQREKLRERTAELERKKAQLETQNERLDRFASFVSHDLRNPLGIAQTYVDFARESGDEDDFEAVDEALDRMETMIDDLLTYARGSQRVEDIGPLAVGDVARDAWSNVETTAATLTVQDAPTIEADEERLLHVFENCFRNSVVHAGPDVTVTVGQLDGDQDGATGFYVADDGPGIDPDEREEIFDHGYTTSDDGSGFGLTIVESFAEAHDWTVSVTESADGGARFEFRIDA